MNKLFLVFVALGILCGASSCNIWRKATGRQKRGEPAKDSALAQRTDPASTAGDTVHIRSDTVLVSGTPAGDSLKQALLQKWLPLWDAQTAYSTFSGKAKMDYEGGGESQELSISIRMERDKRIWISVTGLLGIEGARALITPDTIIAIDRMHKEVRILPFSEADKLLPVHVDFATLQRLIIGDVLQTNYTPNELGDTTQSIVLRAVDPGFVQELTFNHADSLLVSQSLLAENSVLVSLYRDYETVSGRRFSKARELTMQDKGVRHRITLEFNKVSFDEPVDMNISIPQKYERK